MKTPYDLTRWNRAGLSRMRYIDGNAATFLEMLRQALVERFTDDDNRTLQWESLVAGLSGAPPDEDASERLQEEKARIADETEREYLARVTDQYNAARQDWGWEIMRVLARGAHILTETIDAYANEGFLRTATQWDNVRRLVEMLDYHPAPPASAATQLVIEAKPEAGGTLPAGFQVKYSPPDGGAAVVFETLADVQIEAQLNQLRPKDHDRSHETVEGDRLVLENEVADLAIGDPLVLEDERDGDLRAHRIQALQTRDGLTAMRITPPVSPGLLQGFTRVHLKPKDRLAPLGPVVKTDKVKRVLHLTAAPQGLSSRKVIYVTDTQRTYYRQVVSIDGRQVKLNAALGPLRLTEARAAEPVRLAVTFLSSKTGDADTRFRFRTDGDASYLKGQVVAAPEKKLPTYGVIDAQYQPVTEGTKPDEGTTKLTLSAKGTKPALDPSTHVLLVPLAVPGPWQVDTYLKRVKDHLPDALTTGLPKKTSPGDLAVADNGRHMAWARLGSVSLDEETPQAELTAESGWSERTGGDFFLADTTILAHFNETVRLQGWQINTRALTGRRIPLSEAPASLEKGRPLIVENADDTALAFAAAAEAVDRSKPFPELVLDRNLPAGFTFGNTLVAANVAASGHGETKGEKVLGSGDATRSSQSFVFDTAKVAFVADASQPAGVRAAIDVTVAGRTWQQVGGFQDSGPTDTHYTVRMTEDGRLKITFGDGRRGRRLPSGVNNVRITHRKGNGLTGNLAAGSFTKAARPHYLVAQVRQPLPATGGNDMETLEALRENAPATVLTLERAVSLTDMVHLVTGQSSVWQAGAFTRPTGLGRNQKIEVVVVPAGGGGLGGLAETLTEYIRAHAGPGLEIIVSGYRQQTFSLDVRITVNPAAYNPDTIAAMVGAALETAFGLQQRRLGQDLFLSEVYQVVENVEGVQHSRAVINGSGAIRRLPAAEKAVLTLGQLVVTTEDDATA